MGSDIWYNFQNKQGDEWVNLDLDTSSELVETETGWQFKKKQFRIGRHYQLFAVLADVRNGYGFAGCITGIPVVPISKPRGLPDDIEAERYDEDDDYWYNDYGNHSYSWLLGTEMLDWWKTAPTVTKIGILTLEDFLNWDGKSEYEGSWCGGISGNGVHVYDTLEKDDAWIIRNLDFKQYSHITHVRTSWQVDLKNELSYFFDGMIKPLVDEYGEIRFVFGFDS
ncbi:hypothetical protein Phab24_id096 [Acinetobacter phage Phab24]|nr:hypothetical protein Phab24_id096 [Acinetobacter phage Phab24]